MTAERRATFFQQTPISMVALGQDDLDQMNVGNLEELHHFVPNLNIGGDVRGGNSFPLFMIRGVGQASGTASLERGVGLYIDDVYYPRTPGSMIHLLDLNRLEVVRGPQGTLFGRNTTGGAIRYISNAPLDTFEGYVKTSFGSLGQADLQAVVNLPFHEKISGRFHAYGTRSESYVDLSGVDRQLDDEEESLFGGSLQFRPSRNLTVDVRYSKVDIDSPMVPVDILAIDAPEARGGPGDVFLRGLNEALLSAGEPALVDNDPRFVLDDPFLANGRCFVKDNVNTGTGVDFCEYRQLLDYQTVSVDTRWDFGLSSSLRSLTAVIDGTSSTNYDLTGLGTHSVERVGALDSFSQEFQLSGVTDRVNWVGGLFYFEESPDETTEVRFLRSDGSCCQEAPTDRELSTESIGVFAQVTYRHSDRLGLTGGLRYSQDDKSAVLDLRNENVLPLTGEETWDSVDYRATVDYRFSDLVMAYVTSSKGFKSGGFSTTTNIGRDGGGSLFTYDPETVINNEIGIRSQWLGKKLLLNATVYHMNFDDLVTTNTLGISENAGEVEITGFELDFAWAASSRFQIKGSVGNTGLEFKSLNDDADLLIRDTCVDRRNPTFETCEVLDLPRAPEWTTSLEAQWLWPLANQGLVRFTASYGFTDALETTDQSFAAFRVAAYELVNFRVQYDDPKGRYWLALAATNILDEEYYTSAVRRQGTDTALPGQPAQIALVFSRNF
ncbi:MAG: TonB-dependent receptor [Thermoanaerobaculia bacterium]|nr:TonB-dependent receptor [Thermoanaerobaculia bacterium]